jgi:hypothetical protein
MPSPAILTGPFEDIVGHEAKGGKYGTVRHSEVRPAADGEVVWHLWECDREVSIRVLGPEVRKRDTVLAAHSPGWDSVIAEPSCEDNYVEVSVFVDWVGDNARLGDLRDWVIHKGCVGSLQGLEIIVSGCQAATPRLVGWYELGNHNFIIAQPLAHQLLYVGSEGRFDVLTGLIEYEVLEDTIASPFELDAVFEELGRVFKGRFLLITVFEVGASWCKLSHIIHRDPGWIADIMRYGVCVRLEGAEGLYAR